MRRIDLRALALDADEPKCAVCGSNVEEAQGGYSRKAWCSECGKLQPMREKKNVWGPTKAKDARGVVYVQSREERDKLHAYLSKSVGGGESGRRVSSSGAPPNCSVSCEGMSSSELAHWAKVIGCKATTNPVLDAKAKDTFYHAGNLGQESEGQYERMIGFKAGDNVERSGVPGAIYKVLKINGNGSVIIRMFLDAENWDGPMTVVSYDNVIAGRLKKTDKVPRRRAKDAYGYANHNVKKCPGTVYKGGCEGRGRPVPGHVYCAECIKANESRAKDDREYPMPVHRLTGRNPDRCAQCGRPQSDLIHNCTNRFATDRRAKDQVHQDCFDAQILGV